jgi:hypothetical protein
LEAEVKTRVIRYWHQTDWLYKVERYVQATGDEQWVTLRGIKHQVLDVPKAGEWYWAHKRGGISRDLAMSIASRLAVNLPLEDDDIIAEFGE